MKRWLPLLLVVAGCRQGAALDVVPRDEATPPLATPEKVAPPTAGAGARPSSAVPRSGGDAARPGPAIPELDDPPPLVPVQDDGLASSGVPGYQRGGCSPLGPYED